ncbi:MAG TPA: PTS sugar transporter subunit IIA [Tepidisphaeraceae bacterium]|nr:PTS sugar transporter subunit IIA [Tepidisphaeraceae bacterium]
MRLAVRDAARLLNVTEKTIYRWIKQAVIPAYQINDQYRFNRAELLEWATSRKINVSPEIFAEPEGGDAPPPTLSEALAAGGIYYRIGGNDKASALHAVVETMKLPEEVDRQFLFQVLLAREALGSTGIGEGIAIPHVRNPIVLHISRPMVTLCFLERPIDFGALDGRAVTTMFTLISPTVRAHLHLLSRLGFALRAPDFKAAVIQQAPREEICQALLRAEIAMGFVPSTSQPEKTTEP